MNNRGNEVDNTTTTPHNKQVKTDIPVNTNTIRTDKHETEEHNNKPRHAARRHYRKVTPETVARFKAMKAIHGNGTQAVRELEDGYSDVSRRAWLISSKDKELNVGEYVDEKVKQIAVQAVERLQELVQSENEHIATKNVHYTLDRQGGKAIQRTQSTSVTLNIDAILQ